MRVAIKQTGLEEAEEGVYFEPDDSKARNLKKILLWPLILLLLAGIFFVASIYAYKLNEERNQLQAECQNSLKTGQNKGLNVSKINCQPQLNFLTFFSTQSYTDNNQQIKQNLIDQENSLKAKTQDLTSENEILQKQIVSLSVTSLPQKSDNVNNLQTNFEQIKEYNAQLKTLLSQNVGKIDELNNNYKDSLEQNKSLELDTYQSFYTAFQSKSQNEKILSYNNFKLNYLELQNQIALQKLPANSNPKYTILKPTNTELAKYKVFTGKDFEDLYNSVQYPNTFTQSSDIFPMTGDAAADLHIVKLAQGRGYKLRQTADESKLVSIETEKLQPEAKIAYEQLLEAANKDGIKVSLVSGYRAPNLQKELFVSRFNALSISKHGKIYTNAEIVSGTADKILDEVMTATSIPGYSRHHSGYTFDLRDLESDKDFTIFAETKAYAWISANNYYNAKKFGFMPSYPPGLGQEGPNPEPWEYVWVGIDKLKLENSVN